MPFKEGERTITGRERVLSDYTGDPKVPHAENFVDIEPGMGDRVLKISGGRLPNDPGGTAVLRELNSLVINGRRIEWVDEARAEQ